MGIKLDKIYATYKGTEKFDLDIFDEDLRNLPGNEIVRKEDAVKYIEMLNYLKSEDEKSLIRQGKNFPKILRGVLGVGEDGVYFNSTRYLLELLQNVDDCDYKDNNPSVDIFFDNRKNRIVYKYNEDGFTPKNVHDVMGIGGDSKSSSYDRDYIGEKGIGFKSVFGVVDKVRIQSGWFSFDIYEERFTVPEPAYDDFQGYVPGTILTLFMKRNKNVGQIFAELKKKYSVKNSIFSENLVLFLNKLTSVRFRDYDSSLLFNVKRFDKEKTIDGEIECRRVKLYVEQRGGEKIVYEQGIGGYQFTRRVHFTKKEYESRYGDDTMNCGENGRDLPFIVIVPDEDNLCDLKNVAGCLYSYLPTQIKLNVPVAIHSPFKLDSSREYVDSQDQNIWFNKCVGSQRDLLKKAYIEVSRKVKESIIYLLPSSTQEFFKHTNERDFRYFGVSRETFMPLPIFYTNNTYKTSKEIVCIEDKNVVAPRKAFDLSGLSGNLFCCPGDCDPSTYGFETISAIYEKVLYNAFVNPRVTKVALDYLESVENVFKEDDLESFNVKASLTPEQLQIFSRHEHLFDHMKRLAESCLKSNRRPEFSVVPDKIMEGDIHKYVPDFENSILHAGPLSKYFEYTGKRCYLVNWPASFCLPAKNILCLSRDNALDSYIAFVSSVESNNIFYADAIISREMERIETYVDDYSISDEAYLNFVYEAQSRARRDMTPKGYAKYIENLLDAGISPTRCVKELLQNADDCVYPPNQTPTISIINRGNSFRLSYNEVGFTRENLKAITSIAGSTKEDETSSVGYKGIGFKSIFCIATRVQIHSGNFNFQLSKNAPTIPIAIPPETKPYNGTVIMFELQDETMTGNVLEELSAKNTTSLILCLRKLKKFNILGSLIEINDEDGYRNIFFNGERKYVFRKYTKEFKVDYEVKKDKKSEDVQSISCYYQITNTAGQVDDSPMKSYVYCGLPTEIETYNHMFIDANFDLVASRDDLRRNEWNRLLIEKAVDAVAEFLCELVKSLRSDVFGLLGLRSYAYNQRVEWALFSSVYMQDQSDWLEKLKGTVFLPTYDECSYIAPNDEDGVRYPAPATYLLRNKKITLSTPSSKIIDAPQTKIIDGHETRMEAIYKSLDLPIQNPNVVLDEIGKYIVTYISERPFRESLYLYLPVEVDKNKLKDLAIIPLLQTNTEGETKYVAYGDNTFYYLESKSLLLKIDISEYLILDTNIMSTQIFFSIFGKYAYPLNETVLRQIYTENLEKKVSELVSSGNFDELYRFLVDQIETGKLQKNDCTFILDKLQRSHHLPMKNIAGNIVTKRLFYSENGYGYFKGKVMNELSVSYECVFYVEYVDSCLNEITANDIFNYFEDIDPDFKLESADIEDLMDDYFVGTRWTLIHELYRKGLIDFELIQKYSLETFVEDLLSNDMGPFPSDAVHDERALRTHMDEEYPTYGNIESIELLRSVRQVERNGKYYDIDSHELRLDTLSRYRPDSFSGRNVGGDWCFCQCCGTPKKENFIEVVSIERKSDKYRPPMRMALCLVCAKKYEELRANSTWVSQFEECLVKANHKGDKPVTIEVGENGYKYTFTQMHLAEIQYILEHDKKDGKG